jgi:hypothetical protein
LDLFAGALLFLTEFGFVPDFNLYIGLLMVGKSMISLLT